MAHDHRPRVSVIIPTWNEEASIAECLAGVAAQDLPLEQIEVVVVDGASSDGTVGVVTAVARDIGFAACTVVRNERRRTSTSLNVGLAHAHGDIVVRLDARARIAPDYISSCVRVLDGDRRIGVVGGAQVPRARSRRLIDRSIARGLRNTYATGMSRYRRTSASGPGDTVWMGTFRRAELEDLGGWNEEVALNEDWELNARYRSQGSVVWVIGGLTSAYLPRANLRLLARQYFSFGRVKGMWWVRGMRPTPRQTALVVAPVVAFAAAVAVVRRFGARSLLGIPVALLAIDAAGAPEPAADAGERVGASVAIAVYVASWWVGVVVGAVGEVLGVEHEHRSAPS